MRSVVIVAAGESVRYGKNKLNEFVLDKSVLLCAVQAFDGLVDEIVVVGEPFDCPCNVKFVSGGATRFLSVKNGLSAVSSECKTVAVHDGARPFVSRRTVEKLFCQAEKFGSAVPRLPITDTLWRDVESGVSPVCRQEFFTVQTPQVFEFSKLMEAFAGAENPNYTDESTLFFETFGSVNFVDGEFSNKKITLPNDLPTFRVGVGFDVHAFGAGNGFVLGGVHVPYDKKLVGHSDADVLAHAVCDAVLSASGHRDIGVQFPDTDDAYLGADSLGLLAQCVAKAAKTGFSVENVSAVVICQAPKIAPYVDAMAAKLAAVLGVSATCVNLSATTTERLGALGNGDGIAVQAQAILCKKR